MGEGTETIEEWAARTAPTHDWEAHHRVFEGGHGDDDLVAMADAGLIVLNGRAGDRMTWSANVPKAEALEAYRDKVAAGLDEGRRRTLLWVAGFEHGVQWMSGEALSLGLIVDAGYLTPFGREVARILEDPGEAE